MSHPSLDLSVILVSWNTKELLLRCLMSVCGQITGMETEIHVVDNGSRDGSVAAVRKSFPQVRLQENQVNLGFAAACNQALRRSSGKYVLLLNPDTEVTSGAIRRLVTFMEENPRAGAAGAQLLNADGSKQNSVANFPSLATELLNKHLLRSLFPERYPGKERAYGVPIEVESLIGACMMVRREAVDQVGGLDEDYFLFLEETDWCFRMKQKGWKIYHVPAVQVCHFQGKSAALEKKRARLEYHRSRYHFFKKHRGKVQWVLLLGGVVMRLFVEVVSAAMACLITLFRSRKWRERLSTGAYLLWWHLRLCPADMGLKAGGKEIRNANIEVQNKFKISIF